jgi:hypothetical protein
VAEFVIVDLARAAAALSVALEQDVGPAVTAASLSGSCYSMTRASSSSAPGSAALVAPRRH